MQFHIDSQFEETISKSVFSYKGKNVFYSLLVCVYCQLIPFSFKINCQLIYTFDFENRFNLSHPFKTLVCQYFTINILSFIIFHH